MRSFFIVLFFAGSIAAESDTARCPYTYYDDTMYSPFLYGEWLYWQPVTQDPMNWQVQRNEFTNTNPVITSRFSYQTDSLDFGFTSGFRIGAGYRIGKNALSNSTPAWQIEAIYTQIGAEADSSESETGLASASDPYSNDFATNLLPAIFAELDDFLKGHSVANLNYQRCDIEFVWPFWLSGGGVIRLLIGPTLTWIGNHWKTVWIEAIPDPGTNQVDFEWKWWGGGLNLGADFHFPIGKGLGLYFNGATSFSMGKMEEKEKYSFVDSSHDLYNSNVYHFHSFQPELNCGAGLDYKYWVRRKVLIHLSVGWEFTWWFLMNQFGRVNDPSYSNNLFDRPEDVDLATIGRFFDNSPSGLGFHGLTLRAGLDF